ncbi:MAG TPA: prepilin-type N-terminal cleavage/methylation domain-containing protein [Planctomycetes bacterium]|nr:prepilin-type N-terminal cleavage/methylation domain-containing protein [Planctomycetota bacterium]HIJ70299.1 prepilin-type N-terminal cleavage/methylation domain-containing protein [Planctomycetota bacterium]
MKRGFTLTEFVIAAAILGIMAAAAAPVYQSYVLSAKESAAKDNLRVLRNVIEIYAIQHNGIPPGYVENDLLSGVSSQEFESQLTHSEVILQDGSADEIRRTGLVMIPENPFNGRRETLVISEEKPFPAEPVEPDFFGWIYKPATKNIRVNWPGAGKDGVRYFDY